VGPEQPPAHHDLVVFGSRIVDFVAGIRYR
jgi:hypothetical protein